MTDTVVEPTLEVELFSAIDDFMTDIAFQTIVEASTVLNFALDLRLIVASHNAN